MSDLESSLSSVRALRTAHRMETLSAMLRKRGFSRAFILERIDPKALREIGVPIRWSRTRRDGASHRTERVPWIQKPLFDLIRDYAFSEALTDEMTLEEFLRACFSGAPVGGANGKENEEGT